MKLVLSGKALGSQGQGLALCNGKERFEKHPFELSELLPLILALEKETTKRV